MTSVVEHARSIINNFARRRHNASQAEKSVRSMRNCGNLKDAIDDRVLVGRVDGLEPHSSQSPKEAANTVGVGAKFGKYYLEKIANLDHSVDSGSSNRYSSERMIRISDPGWQQNGYGPGF